MSTSRPIAEAYGNRYAKAGSPDYAEAVAKVTLRLIEWRLECLESADEPNEHPAYTSARQTLASANATGEIDTTRANRLAGMTSEYIATKETEKA